MDAAMPYVFTVDFDSNAAVTHKKDSSKIKNVNDAPSIATMFSIERCQRLNNGVDAKLFTTILSATLRSPVVPTARCVFVQQQ